MNMVDIKYQIKEEVYLTTDIEQRKRVVTEIKLLPTGILYTLSCGTVSTDHYDFELSREIDQVLKSS